MTASKYAQLELESPLGYLGVRPSIQLTPECERRNKLPIERIKQEKIVCFELMTTNMTHDLPHLSSNPSRFQHMYC